MHCKKFHKFFLNQISVTFCVKLFARWLSWCQDETQIKIEFADNDCDVMIIVNCIDASIMKSDLGPSVHGKLKKNFIHLYAVKMHALLAVRYMNQTICAFV